MRIHKDTLSEKFCVIITSIILFPAALLAQDNLKIKEVAKLGSGADNIIHAYEEIETGKVISIYANYKGGEVIIEGVDKGMQTAEYESGVIVGANHIHQFDQNEFFLFQNEEGIYTRKHLDDNSFLIRRYAVNNNQLQRINEKAFAGGIETQFYAIENSSLIVETDDFEEYGSKYVFYSKDLNVLSTYTPKGGFKESSFASNGKEILLVLSPFDSNREKLLVTVDVVSGKVKNESQIVFSSAIQFIVSTKNHFVLKTFDQRLVAITVKGQVVWQKENIDIGALHLPGKNNILYEASNNNLYLLSATKRIISLDGSNGNMLWEKNWTEFQPSSSSTMHLQPIAFKSLSIKQQVVVVFKEQIVGRNSPDRLRALRAYFISSKGQIAATKTFATDLSNIKLFESRRRSSFYILTNNTITRYE